jgi:hypothetical protein
MKISVITATRCRPAGLITLSNMLWQLASGEHEITHWLSLDYDDDMLMGLLPVPEFVETVWNPRPDSLGEVWNAPFRKMDRGWDVCTLIADDVYPITPHWDKAIAAISAEHEVSAWRENNDPTGPGHTIMTRKFVEALGGEPYTRWFPFWFDDPWLNEVHSFAFGRQIPIVTDLQLYARDHGVCQGMRDLTFWVDFWIATRCLRIEQGHRLAAVYGIEWLDSTPVIRFFEGLDQQWAERIPRIERACGADDGEPSARYLRAKAKAQAWLNTRATEAA